MILRHRTKIYFQFKIIFIIRIVRYIVRLSLNYIVEGLFKNYES